MEHQILDTSGLTCPLPLLKLKKVIKTQEAGAVIKLITTDASSAADIPSFCELTHNRLLDSYTDNDVSVFFIQKGN